MHAFETVGRVLSALFEQIGFGLVALASLVAALVATAGQVAVGGPGSLATSLPLPLLELIGFAAGFCADLHARGQAYAQQHPSDRADAMTEWRSRLGWAVIGLFTAFLFSPLVHSGLDHVLGDLGRWAYAPASFCLVLVAVPVIDLIRGVARIIAGADAQTAFAGLVIGWAQRRAHRSPAKGEPRIRSDGSSPGPDASSERRSDDPRP